MAKKDLEKILAAFGLRCKGLLRTIQAQPISSRRTNVFPRQVMLNSWVVHNDEKERDLGWINYHVVPCSLLDLRQYPSSELRYNQ